jgi:hypothetical protein
VTTATSFPFAYEPLHRIKLAVDLTPPGHAGRQQYSARPRSSRDPVPAAYGWDREFDRRAAKLAEEILIRIWDRESDLDP